MHKNVNTRNKKIKIKEIKTVSNKKKRVVKIN